MRPSPRTRSIAMALALASVLSAAAPVTAQSASARPVIADAEPYEDDEFPRWARDLRRAEIVAFGSLPISLLASRLIYAVARFTYKSIELGTVASAYLPPSIAPPGAVPLSREESAWVVLGAISISSIIAVVDYMLGVDEGTND